MRGIIRNLFFIAGLYFGLLISPLRVFAETPEEISQLIQKMNSEKDPSLKAEQIKNLGNRPYKEVVDALIEVIRSNSTSNTPSDIQIANALESISKTGGPSTDAALREISSEFKNLQNKFEGSPRTYPTLQTKFLATQQRVKANKEPKALGITVKQAPPTPQKNNEPDLTSAAEKKPESLPDGEVKIADLEGLIKKAQLDLALTKDRESLLKIFEEIKTYKYQEISGALFSVIEDQSRKDPVDQEVLVRGLQVYSRIAGGAESITRYEAFFTAFKARADSLKFVQGEKPGDKDILIAEMSITLEQLKKNLVPVDLKYLEPMRKEMILLDYLHDQILELTMNEYGTSIPAIHNPKTVEKHVEEVKKSLDRLSAVDRKLRPVEARLIIEDAIKLLYSGRGRTPGEKPDTYNEGWNQAGRNTKGSSELETIIKMGLLDKTGIKNILKFFEDFDHTDPKVREGQGFAPTMPIGSDEIKNKFIKLLKEQEPAEDYIQYVSQNQNMPSTLDLIKAAQKEGKINSNEAKALRGFLGSLENNFYDESVEVINTPGEKFTEYFGREKEVIRINDVITKIEKGHVLMTGKAGVGKSTILRMLSDLYVQSKLSIRDELPPIVLELPITAVTNKQDPTQIKTYINSAKFFSKALNRRIFIFVDEAHISSTMTRNAMKSFLTEMIKPLDNKSKVHMVFATTSSEARDLLQDSAFRRRWSDIEVSEFDRDQTIQLIKQAFIPRWQYAHKKKGYTFNQVTDDAYEYAYRYGHIEQSHSGRPTGPKELLEGAIARKLNLNGGKIVGRFDIDVPDIQAYLKDNKGIELVAGDPEFQNLFNKKWEAFDQDYIGNEGAKMIIRDMLLTHFGSLSKNKMLASIAFGPPGGGKTFLSEKIAEHFFKGAILRISGAEYKEGGLALNKLIGSPTGTVGSEEQRSILTKFISENPQGGVIKIEEADYLHSDVVQLLTNMITDKEFTDGLGKVWKTDNFIIQMNTNVGQEAMIPPDSSFKMTWEQFDTRRRQLVEHVKLGDKSIERVRKDRLEAFFDQFMEKVVTSSDSFVETSLVQAEASKQKRRYTPMYILPPTKEELLKAARAKVASFKRQLRLEFNMPLEFSDDDMQKIIDLDHYEFTKGHSYVIDNLQQRFFDLLSLHLHHRGKKISARVQDSFVEIGEETVPARRIIVEVEGQEPIEYHLGAVSNAGRNPWGDNPEMVSRIRNFTRLMSEQIKGNKDVLEQTKDLFVQKASDWSSRVVVTLLGTTGNGKTEYAKALGRMLFGDEDAYFEVTGVTHEYQLNDYFGSPKAFVGSNEETKFERWVKTRIAAGGGVILFDELLSLSGLDNQQLSDRLGVINKIYTLLDTGHLSIRGRDYDLSGFPIVITGNSLQEFFAQVGDDPDSEQIIKDIQRRITRNEIVKYFAEKRIDAPKLARFGQIHVLGPQPRHITRSVGLMKVQQAIKEINARRSKPIEIIIDNAATYEVVRRLSTVTLGMREVNRGFKTLLFSPLHGIIQQFRQAQKIEAKFDSETSKVTWFVNGKEVIREGVPIDNDEETDDPEDIKVESNWTYKDQVVPDSKDTTPQVKDLQEIEKLHTTPETFFTTTVHEYYGHWMMDILLHRENKHGAMSLLAGEGYLGYVRKKFTKIHEGKTLSSIFKELLYLNAGHRSDFHFNIFATGGGNNGSKRKDGEPNRDDLGKMQDLINAMINNNLVPEIHEASSPRLKSAFEDLTRKVVNYATDYILKAGLKSKQFEPGFLALIRKKFYSEKELDELVQKMDFKEFGSKDELFLNAMIDAIDKVSRENNGTLPAKAKSNLHQILSRFFAEAIRSNLHNPDEIRKLEELKVKAQQKLNIDTLEPEFSNVDFDCAAAITSALKMIETLPAPTAQ